MAMPAGCEPPAPDAFEGLTRIHAVDGDGASLCGELAHADRIDAKMWADVPELQQCPLCGLILSGAARSTS
jgi:hypothetical protein